MADDTTQKDPAAKDAKKPAVVTARHPIADWSGELIGVTFVGGRATLPAADRKVAIGLTEYGCQIADGDGDPAHGTGTAAEQARIQASARWAYRV